MKYLYLALFAIVSVIHLIDSYRDNGKRRKKTKGFIIPLLTLYYVTAADSVSFLLLGALITSWLGDVLLIPRGNKWFVTGGISFMLSHFLFTGVYLNQINFSSLKWITLIPVALLYFFVSGIVMYKVKPNASKAMFVALFIYLIVNSIMNIFSLMQLITNPSIGSAVAYLGAVLFFISDCTLFIVRYCEKIVIFKRHFTIMLTYITGELLITQGILILTA